VADFVETIAHGPVQKHGDHYKKGLDLIPELNILKHAQNWAASEIAIHALIVTTKTPMPDGTLDAFGPLMEEQPDFIMQIGRMEL
jgi:hypothetical protein